jgi:hypothetical protein
LPGRDTTAGGIADDRRPAGSVTEVTPTTKDRQGAVVLPDVADWIILGVTWVSEKRRDDVVAA